MAYVHSSCRPQCLAAAYILPGQAGRPPLCRSAPVLLFWFLRRLRILHTLRNSTSPTAYSACAVHPLLNLPAGVAKAAAAARASVQGLISASAAKAADAWLLCQKSVQQLAQRVRLPDVQPAVALPLIMASGGAGTLA